jgi:hypothetical protein
MEEVTDTFKDSTKETNFFKFVFNFDEDNKAQIMNMLQYALIGIIPVMILLKLIKEFIPEVDESKGNIELLVESVSQLVVIFMGIWLIHRMIRFVPTYSGKEYSPFNENTFTLAFLISLFTMQTKLGEKFHILFDRVMELWNGKTNSMNSNEVKDQGQNNVIVSQPLAMAQPTHQQSRSDMMNPLNDILPAVNMQQSMPANDIKNFNGMYEPAQQSGGQMDQMAQIGQMGMNEPMAANDALGGGFGSSF